MSRIALDTNAVAYAGGVGDARRCKAVRQIIFRLPAQLVVIPAQVLGELHRVLVGKAHRTAAEGRAAILSWADTFEIADSTFAAIRAALDLAVDHQMPTWDALILSVSADQKCRVLLSEDFQHGFTWSGVTVLNPFVSPQHPLLAAAIAQA